MNDDELVAALSQARDIEAVRRILAGGKVSADVIWRLPHPQSEWVEQVHAELDNMHVPMGNLKDKLAERRTKDGEPADPGVQPPRPG